MTAPDKQQLQWDMATVRLMCADLRKAIATKDWILVAAVAALGEGMAAGFRLAQQDRRQQKQN